MQVTTITAYRLIGLQNVQLFGWVSWARPQMCRLATDPLKVANLHIRGLTQLTLTNYCTFLFYCVVLPKYFVT